MKTPTLLLSAFICSSMLLGCKKEQVVRSTNISNAQAAVMAATALSVNAYGFTSIKNDVTLYAGKISTNGKGCGVLDSAAVARQEPASSNINYNYALGYYYTVNCTSGIRDNLTSAVIYNGSFDAPNLSAVNSANSNLNVSSLTQGGSNYIITGNYQTIGSFQTLDASDLTGSNAITINVNSLQVDKNTRNIVGGTADITITGTIKNSKNTFNYTGSVIFTDANTAILTLPGVSYRIDLTTADVTAL